MRGCVRGFAASLLLAGCVFDSGGGGGPPPAGTIGAGDSGSTGGAQTTAEGSSTAATSGAASTAGSGDATVTSATTTVGGAETGDATSDGMGDAESSSTSGAAPLMEYDDCVGELCSMPGDFCNQVDGHQWCGQACNFDLDCPLAATGSAVPVCTFGLGSGRCVLSCGFPLAFCPDGMTCEDVAAGNGTVQRCMW